MPIAVTKDQCISCCASASWAERVATGSPYRDFPHLLDAARRIWWTETGVLEWLNAFAAHPKIGDNKLPLQPSAFAAFSRSEQAAANQSSSTDVAQELLKWNK